MRVRGNEHSKRSALPWRSKASGAFGSLRQFSAVFVCLGSCLAALALAEMRRSFFLTMATTSQAVTTIFSILNHHYLCVLHTKGVAILLPVTLPTRISLSSPELDMELSELERFLGEWRENRR